MGGQEQDFINEAFEQNWIAPLGPNVDGFEQDIVEYTACGYAAALSSGTAAIHLALILGGVKAGDYVLCSSFTFSASANPILYQGAVPVFIDSEEETWNMDPQLLEEAIQDLKGKGNMPKALVFVHLYGMPGHIEEIKTICEREGILLIEDAAEALGSSWKGRALGTFGDFGIYSFNGNKIITTSGGGALVSKNEEWIKRSRFLATQARDPFPHYEHSEIGYNYRMSNILAGIGRGQMQVLPKWIERRRKNFAYYYEHLSDNGFFFSNEREEAFSNRWLTCVLLDSNELKQKGREALRLFLEEQNIESRPLWKPMHLQPVFKQYPAYLNGVSESLFKKGLCLPSGSSLEEDDLKKITGNIKKFIET